MKIALAQTAPHLGDVRANLDVHLATIAKAKKTGAGLVVFPELSLTGYTLKDMAEEVGLDPFSSPAMKKLIAASGGISVILGFVEENPKEKGVFYNSAALISERKVLGIHRKVFLPTFGIFEEAKFLGPGTRFAPVKAPFGRLGMLICRDFLHFGSSYVHYAGGADMIVTISASPGRGIVGGRTFDSARMWELMGEAVSYFTSCFVVYVNRVGVEDGMTFAGGSFIYAPGGRMLARAADVEPEFLLQEIDLKAVREARRSSHFKRDEKPEVILRSLERIVRGNPED